MDKFRDIMQKPARSKGEPHTYFVRVSAKSLCCTICADLLNLGQIIISIPTASQKVSSNETNSRKIEQLITWAESGSGPGIEKIYEVIKKTISDTF